MTDYSLVVLGNYEQKLFNRLKKVDVIQCTIAEREVLMEKRLAFPVANSWTADGQGKLEITGFGKGLRAYQAKVSSEKHFKWIQFWIPTLISLAALIKSFFF